MKRDRPSWATVQEVSDEFAGASDLDDLLIFYAGQVRLYTQFWEQITGEPVKEPGLYFTSINRRVMID